MSKPTTMPKNTTPMQAQTTFFIGESNQVKTQSENLLNHSSVPSLGASASVLMRSAWFIKLALSELLMVGFNDISILQ